MADVVRLHNYKRSIGIHSSTEGFEAEALGACIGLTLYGSLSQAARQTWITAAQRAALDSSTNQGADLVLHKRFFYSALLLRKGVAFGFDLNPKWDDFDYAQCPWGLPDEVFAVVYDDLKHGKGKAHVEAMTWGNLTDKVKDYASNHVKLLAYYGFASAAVGPVKGKIQAYLFDFAKKYAPELVEKLSFGPELAMFTLIGFGGLVMRDAEVPSINQADLAEYDIDFQRRQYDHSAAMTLAEHE